MWRRMFNSSGHFSPGATLLLCLALLVLVAGSAAAEKRETILVGGNRDYPPYELVDKNGQPAGFTVDLLRAIAEVMGMKVEITLGEWARRREIKYWFQI